MAIRLASVVWFHFAWLACVYCGLERYVWVSLLLPIVSFFILSRMEKLTPQRMIQLLQLAFIGIVFDFIAIRVGWVTFPVDEGFFPIWLLSMWLLFVSILPVAELFKNRLVLAAVLGAIFGPLSYYSGKAFGVLSMSGMLPLVAYAVFWSVFFPFSLKFLKGSNT